MLKDLLHVTTAPAGLMALISGQIMREMRDLRLITDQSEPGRGRGWPIRGQGAGGDGLRLLSASRLTRADDDPC